MYSNCVKIICENPSEAKYKTFSLKSSNVYFNIWSLFLFSLFFLFSKFFQFFSFTTSLFLSNPARRIPLDRANATNATLNKPGECGLPDEKSFIP